MDIDGDQVSHQALSIGVVDGGSVPEANWDEPLAALSRAAARVFDGSDAPLEVNVVFHVPGRFLDPEFSGTRTGSFSRRRKMLAIQVALSEQAPADVDQHLRLLLWEAVELAEAFAYEEGMGSNLLHRTKALLPAV